MIRWMQKRRAVVLACLVALVFTVARTGGRPVSAQKAGAAVQAPRFEVDPLCLEIRRILSSITR